MRDIGKLKIGPSVSQNINLTIEQQKAVKGLETNHKIIIKMADKGCNVVLMDSIM